MSSAFESYRKSIRKDLDGRNKVIQQLYSDDALRQKVYSYILNNGGSSDDANHVFVEAIIKFVQRCYSDVFELKSTMESYIMAVARNEWIRSRKNLQQELPHDERMASQEDLEQKLISDERLSAIRNALTDLDEKCRKILLMWASNVKMREIAIRMSYKSDGFARKKKHKCLQKLKLLIEDI